MNVKIRQMTTLLRLARDVEKKALENYSKINQYYRKQEQQLKQLDVFREEYRARLSTVSSQAFSAFELQRYDDFVLQLDSAKKEQLPVTDLAREKAEAAYKEYIKAKQKADAYQKILDSAVQQANAIKAKKEQKEVDEYARNQWYINRQD